MFRTTVLLLSLAGLSAMPGFLYAQGMGKIAGNEFNPAVSLILEGRYTDLDNSELELPGFQPGGEAGLPEKGFSMGHNELVISANVDDKFYGQLTAPILYENNETTIELEEAFMETLGLGHGATVRGGKFYSGIGYLNAVHDHAHDFADRPLVYDALVGGHLNDTGVQLRWVAPTAWYLNLGAEVTTGSEFPGGENEDNNNGMALFAKTGGDISVSASWQLGVSYYSTEFASREAGGHAHGGETAEADNELLDGEVDMAGIDFVYKWAPNGNSRQTNFKFQAEYFVRDEDGHSEFTEGSDSATADYTGEQTGFYMQGVYQFMPAWRVGLRYDRLEADNTITNFSGTNIDQEEYLEESGLGSEAKDPERYSVMVDYSPSHFSLLRLQYSELDNGREKNDMLMLQYIMSLGAHGAHRY
ncbi:porin family protein [Thiohalophilus thiocyanatoxydans]|uniref:Zinc-regulated TonB-dependent outer membrane receptor n=1 Tax=Thiohalophilus thiocyanatoxydans TaxID=381308 RepID=A0A4R8IWT3_9GAMM|nr:hypothetical protein [Thiohalophilus thiocyanatoxydans]TDY03970.1 hypothetical protein EDC23_0341 [Thiohalophilus thiocyanatoxydans]